MPKYLLVYHGGEGMPETEEEGEKLMAAWGAWFERIGPAVVDGGNPVGQSTTLFEGGRVEPNGGANPATGYSILQADDLEDAKAKAAGCPVLQERTGSIELAEIIEL